MTWLSGGISDDILITENGSNAIDYLWDHHLQFVQVNKQIQKDRVRNSILLYAWGLHCSEVFWLGMLTAGRNLPDDVEWWKLWGICNIQ